MGRDTRNHVTPEFEIFFLEQLLHNGFTSAQHNFHENMNNTPNLKMINQ